VGQVRVGHFKEAFSLEELTSSKYITFMERSLPVLAFTPRRNTGIALANTAFDKRMTWAVGGFKIVGDDAEAFSNQSGYDVTGRVTGLPLYQKEGRRLIHLGLGYSHEFNSDVVDFDAKPEANAADPLVFTPDIQTNGTDKLGFEFASVLGPLSVQAELIPAWVDQDGGPNLTFWGTYGTVSWFVTGEHRPYDTRYGAFDRVKPRNRFSLKEGTWGALELAARYSYLDLNDENVRGGVQSNTTLGANWYLYSNLRLMLNWVHAHRNGAGSEDIVQARVSMDF
jgi:phosphate-selective porin OprO/OprP